MSTAKYYRDGDVKTPPSNLVERLNQAVKDLRCAGEVLDSMGLDGRQPRYDRALSPEGGLRDSIENVQEEASDLLARLQSLQQTIYRL